MTDEASPDAVAGIELHLISPAEAARIVARAPAADDRWHSEYPFADELYPLRGLAASTHAEPVFGMYQVRARASGLAIGGIGFFGPPDAEGAVELGYGLIEAARGAGYATAALQLAVEIARAHGAALVKADTAPDNRASQRVLEKAGFTVVDRSNELVFYALTLDDAPADDGALVQRATAAPNPPT